jgi:hypothetical protein
MKLDSSFGKSGELSQSEALHSKIEDKKLFCG